LTYVTILCTSGPLSLCCIYLTYVTILCTSSPPSLCCIYLTYVTILCTSGPLSLCCIYLTYVKLTEMQASRTNFTTEQKVDFTIKAIEQQVPPLL